MKITNRTQTIIPLLVISLFWEQVLGTVEQPGQKVVELAPEVIKKLNAYYALIMSEAKGWGELSIKIDNYGKRSVVSMSMSEKIN